MSRCIARVESSFDPVYPRADRCTRYAIREHEVCQQHYKKLTRIGWLRTYDSTILLLPRIVV
jgi:hypothetical protein